MSAHAQGSQGMPDEPYDRIGHVRICGGDGHRKGRFYPETMNCAGPIVSRVCEEFVFDH